VWSGTCETVDPQCDPAECAATGLCRLFEPATGYRGWGAQFPAAVWTGSEVIIAWEGYPMVLGARSDALYSGFSPSGVRNRDPSVLWPRVSPTDIAWSGTTLGVTISAGDFFPASVDGSRGTWTDLTDDSGRDTGIDPQVEAQPDGFLATSRNAYIWLRSFDAAGNPRAPGPVRLDLPSVNIYNDPLYGAHASFWDGSELAVAFVAEQEGTGIARFTSAGERLAPPVYVSLQTPVRDSWTDMRLVRGNGEYALLWREQYHVYFARVDAAGLLAPPVSLFANETEPDRFQLVFTGRDYVAVWAEYPPEGEVWARRISAQGERGQRLQVSSRQPNAELGITGIATALTPEGIVTVWSELEPGRQYAGQPESKLMLSTVGLCDG
jgi:hypothetical protein